MVASKGPIRFLNMPRNYQQSVGHPEEFLDSTPLSDERYVQRVIVINNIKSGGALKYINDITNIFIDVEFIKIKALDELLKLQYSNGDMICNSRDIYSITLFVE